MKLKSFFDEIEFDVIAVTLIALKNLIALLVSLLIKTIKFMSEKFDEAMTVKLP
jgi:hypothetical protein